MGWEAEFDSQWQTFLNAVETGIRRKANSRESFDIIAVNAIIQEEMSKWSRTNHYNGAWLQKLKRDHGALAEEFQKGLKELRLKNPVSFKLGVPIWHIAAGIGLIVATFVATFLVLRWYELSLVKQLMGAGAVAAMTISILASFLSVRKSKTVNSAVAQIQRELQPIGHRLKEISLKADLSELNKRTS